MYLFIIPMATVLKVDGWRNRGRCIGRGETSGDTNSDFEVSPSKVFMKSIRSIEITFTQAALPVVLSGAENSPDIFAQTANRHQRLSRGW